jgi:hypothetical protein
MAVTHWGGGTLLTLAEPGVHNFLILVWGGVILGPGFEKYVKSFKKFNNYAEGAKNFDLLQGLL